MRGAKALLRRKGARLLLVEASHLLLNQQHSSPLELMRLIASYGYVCTYLRMFAGRETTAHHPVFARAALPPALHNRLSVPFEEMDAILASVPPTNMSGWTDLLCW